MKKLLFLLLLLSTTSSFAMGSRRPGNDTPPAQNPPPTIPIPTIDFGSELGPDEYLNASSLVGPTVDNYKKLSELTKIRTLVNDDPADKCFDDNEAHDQFADQISYYTQKMIKDVPAMVGTIGTYYGTSSNDAAYFPTSLIRHPLCLVNSSTLSLTINKVPSQSTIDELNHFASTVNALRTEVMQGNLKAKVELLTLWSRFFSCLAYSESLGTADSSKSQNVAKKFSPSGYRKPAGVEFYEDPAQPPESKLNIGAFQFTPNKTGNISPCLKAWNKLHAEKPSCQLPVNDSTGKLIKILGSSYQSFNVFCGVHKLVQTFAIQVNTTKSSSTFPTNMSSGKLKTQEERCVTPHFQAGKAYNHFGPFQNSTGSNLQELMSCTLHSQN